MLLNLLLRQWVDLASEEVEVKGAGYWAAANKVIKVA